MSEVGQAVAVPAVGIVREIPLGGLIPSKSNPRKHFDQVKLDELADSIREKGIIVPLVVRAHTFGGNGARAGEQVFEIVAGERRYRAAKLAKIETAPCIVRELDDLAALELQVIENLQRDDVQPLEEAAGYKALMEIGEYDVTKIADSVGKSEKYVYDRIKLLELVPEARKQLEAGKMTAGHAIVIARREPEEQKAILEELPNHYGADNIAEMPVKEFEREVKWRDQRKENAEKAVKERAEWSKKNAAQEARWAKERAEQQAQNKKTEALRKREVEFREGLLVAAVKVAGEQKRPSLALKMVREACHQAQENFYDNSDQRIARALGAQLKDEGDAGDWLAKYIAKAKDLQLLALYLFAVSLCDHVDFGGKEFDAAIAEHLPAKQLADAKAAFAAETKRLAKVERDNAKADATALAKAKKTAGKSGKGAKPKAAKKTGKKRAKRSK